MSLNYRYCLKFLDFDSISNYTTLCFCCDKIQNSFNENNIQKQNTTNKYYTTKKIKTITKSNQLYVNNIRYKIL